MEQLIDIPPDVPPDTDPNEEFPARRPTELIFTALFVMMITADIAVFITCKIYKNLSSMFLLGATIMLILFRLADYAFRLLVPRFSIDYP